MSGKNTTSGVLLNLTPQQIKLLRDNGYKAEASLAGKMVTKNTHTTVLNIVKKLTRIANKDKPYGKFYKTYSDDSDTV